MQDPRGKIQEATCTARVGGKVCGGTLQPGQAILQAIQWSDEGTCSPANWAGVAPIVEVLKCQSCGHSFIPAQVDASATGIEAQVCADIATRQQRGIAKYGVTVQDNPLPLKDWLQHAYEETLDQAIYLKRAIEEMENARCSTDRENPKLWLERVMKEKAPAAINDERRHKMQDPRLKVQESTCTARVGGKICGGTLQPGQAIPQAIQCSEEGTISQANWGGVAPIVKVLKCQSCGHSFIPATAPPVDGLAEMPGSAFWPLFKHMSQEHGLSLLDSELADICHAVDAMRADWKAKAVDPAAICSRFATDDARLLQLRGASTKQLVNILAESVNGEVVISAAYFALGMDSRFRETQPEELRELIATVILERRGANKVPTDH